MKRYRAALTAILSAGVLVLTACESGSESPGAAADDCSPGNPMTIDALVAVSGQFASVGEAMSAGMKAAVTTINDNGGVLGSPLTLDIHDNAGTADQTAAVLQELVSKGRPDAVIPGSASEMAAGIPILANAGVFTAHHFPGTDFNDPAKYPYAFGSAHSTDHYIGHLAAELAAKGYKKIGYLRQDDAGGEAHQKTAEKYYGELGLEPEFVAVANEAIDATPQLQKVLAGKPDALVFTAFGSLAGVMAQARDKLDVHLPTYGTQSYSASPLNALGPESLYDEIILQSLVTSVKGTEAQRSEAFQTFYTALQKETGGKIPFGINAYVVAYNDVILAASAANLAGCVNPARMAKAIQDAEPADLPFYVAPVDFSADDHYANFSSDWFIFHRYGPLEAGLIVPKS
ncbi:ABC transporter substrate-binding protein [Phytohabitans kaempferiae]|uniref:ABC transporter substrate-binding protein n=1 Tax=Phytohabitans kaempferiae TaxID=1620943 RepID=A0ABV6M5P1_9ACTN